MVKLNCFCQIKPISGDGSTWKGGKTGQAFKAKSLEIKVYVCGMWVWWTGSERVSKVRVSSYPPTPVPACTVCVPWACMCADERYNLPDLLNFKWVFIPPTFTPVLTWNVMILLKMTHPLTHVQYFSCVFIWCLFPFGFLPLFAALHEAAVHTKPGVSEQSFLKPKPLAAVNMSW